MEKPQRPEPDEAFAKLKMIDYFRDLDLWADQEHARAERLTGELDKELQRRFDGNRIASQEHAEDIHALQAQLTEAKEALDRAHKVFAHEMDERAKEAHESQMYRGLLKSADGYLTDHDENCTLHLAIKARLYGE